MLATLDLLACINASRTTTLPGFDLLAIDNPTMFPAELKAVFANLLTGAVRAGCIRYHPIIPRLDSTRLLNHASQEPVRLCSLPNGCGLET